jgi:hypothetical protein
VYSFIKFRASDILELQVVSQPKPSPAYEDPAILSATEAPQQQQTNTQETSTPPAVVGTTAPPAPASSSNTSAPPGMPASQPAQIKQQPQKQRQQQPQQQQHQQKQQQQQQQQKPAVEKKSNVLKINPGKPAWGGNAAKSMSKQLRSQQSTTSLANNNRGGNRQNNNSNSRSNRQQRNNNYNNNYNNNNNNNNNRHSRQQQQRQPRPAPAQGSGSDLLARDNRRGGQMQQGGITNSQIQGQDFNFQEGLEKFNSLNLKEEKEMFDNDTKDEPTYTKGDTMDSFFDSITTASSQRQSGSSSRPSRDDQRKQNLDTFGVEGLQRDRNYNRRRRRNNNRGRRRNNGPRQGNAHAASVPPL